MNLKVEERQDFWRFRTILHRKRQEAMPCLNSHESYQSTLALLSTHRATSHFLLHSLVFMPHRRHGMLPGEPVWSRDLRLGKRNEVELIIIVQKFSYQKRTSEKSLVLALLCHILAFDFAAYLLLPLSPISCLFFSWETSGYCLLGMYWVYIDMSM